MDAGRWQAKLSVLLTIFLGMGPVLIWYVMIGGGAPPAAARRWQPLASLPQDAAPAPNALSVPAPATLALTFDEPVNLTSVTSRAFAVHGSQRPRFKGAYELSNLSRAIFFDPERKFFPGERVDASVTTGTRNITGEHAISPMVGQFWAATKGGSAHFIDSGQSITGTDYGRDSVLGDLDGDGDLDAFGANIGNQDTIRRNKPVATDEVYVSALGGDDDEGQNHCADNAAPCRTVAHAIDMVEASGTVYIAQGVYTENLSIYKPLTLAGGYESAGWTRDIHTYQTILDGSAHQTVRGEWDGSGIQSASVISDGGMYKMWYHGWDLAYDSFGLATSSDGSNWTKSAANPVYTTTDHWGHIAYPFVLKDGATFKLWYAGEGAIYYGESSDGITWDVDTSAPVLEATEGAWDASGLSAPFVLQLGADDYRMWYQAEDKSGIGYATSTDGITWTKHPTPVLAPETGESWDMDGVGDPALWFDGGAYHMWYVNASNWLMGYATSTNGIDWNKYGDNPVFFTGVSGEWDDVNVAAPRVLFDQGEYQMWYAGYGGSDFKWQRGYAVSPDGVTWSKYGDNPVLSAENGGWWGQPVVTLDEGSTGSALEGLTITGGDAQDAGGVYIEVQDVNIRKCHFHHNAADSYQHHDAGAVIRASDTLRVADSIFTQNYTKWAGASAIRAMTLSVTNTLFADNRGDAALHLNGAGRLMNVTIANNDGGMIYNPTMTGTLRITNSVIYHNGYAISDLSTDTTSVAYSDIEGGWPGEGNLDAKPWFVDAANGDFHLLPWSSLIDAGTEVGAPDYDLEGTARPQNSGFDIGALEFSGTLIANQGPRYVAPTGVDADICIESGSPCRTIQYAVDQAAPGDEIRIAEGNYTQITTRTTPSAYPGAWQTPQIAYVDKSLTLRGGYTTTDWALNDPDAYPVVLDAGERGRGLFVFGAITSTVAGLRITGGDASGLGGYYDGAGYRDAGGGLYVFSATLTLSNTHVYGNHIDGYRARGGGIYMHHAADALVQNNIIFGNTATGTSDRASGGGLFIDDSPNARVIQNQIYGNSAAQYGGGLAVNSIGAALYDNVIYQNTANYGGGVNLSQDVIFSGNEVSENRAYFDGGGVALSEGSDNAILQANRIWDNVAHQNGGGIHAHLISNGKLENNVIRRNRADGQGSGMSLVGSTVGMLHTTFSDNQPGAGLYLASMKIPTPVASRAFLINTILVSHTVGITATAGNTATVDSVLWRGNVANIGGGGAIDVTRAISGDPLFAADGYHLRDGSAAIDQGIRTSLAVDIDGQPRAFGAAPDLGADEIPDTLIWLVTNPADSGLDTLRAALVEAVSGDTIVFDTRVFPPTSPTTITLSSPLPSIEVGNLMLDGSDAGVVIDGGQVGMTPETLLLDAVSMRVDGGADLIVNGDFDAGMAHWRPWDDAPGATRDVNTMEPYISPHAYSWETVARVGSGRTFYDTTATDAPLDGQPAPTSTVWITATGNATVEVDFWYQYERGALTLKLWVRNEGGASYWFSAQRFEAAPEWTPGTYRATLPGDVTAFALEINYDHSERWATGLSLASDHNTVRGVQIINFPGHGLTVSGGHNTIGGDRNVGAGPLGQGNRIAGNHEYGIGLSGFMPVSNTVQGNYIGVNVAGAAAQPNGSFGVGLLDVAQYNLIGGATPGRQNLISGNGRGGVNLAGSNVRHNHIQGNLIGVDAAGSFAIPNRAFGGFLIDDGAAYNTVADNLISGNDGPGVQINVAGTHHITVTGNFIGVDAGGVYAIPNAGAGLSISEGGAENTIADNLISGNEDAGVIIGGSGAMHHVVIGNRIGVDVSGLIAVPNINGILIRDGASANRIGGLTAESENLIAYNDGAGILVKGSASHGNALLRNRIHSNGGLGIDLAGDGVTHNDKLDVDSGPNNLQNFPVLLSVITDTVTTTIRGRLHSVPSTTFTLRFFSSPACDASGYGEGQDFLGAHVVETDARGNVYFRAELARAVPDGHFVAATATDPDGDTSEFSFCAVPGIDNTSWPKAHRLQWHEAITNTYRAGIEQRITRPGESRWYKVTVQPESRLIIALTDLPANYDLTVYKDIAETYRSLTTLTDTNDLEELDAEFAPDAFAPDAFAPDAFAPDAFAPDAFAPDAFAPDAFAPDAFAPDAFAPDAFAPDAFAPDAFAPDAFAPDAFAPDAFAPDAFAPDAFAPDAFAPDAFASAQMRSLIGISAFNGTTGEGIILNTWQNAGDFYIRVRGRGEVHDAANPFSLNLIIQSDICHGVTDELPVTSLTPTAGDYKTVILADFGRMTGATQTLQSELATLAARPEVAGVIVDVGQDARVAAANAQADAHPTCPYAKNLVAEAVKAVSDRYWDENPLEYIVIVGNDDVIPFFRHPDQAMLANESGYVPPVRDNTASQASLKLGYVLSQDRYAARVNLSQKEHKLPVPELGIGRLVETPADMMRVIDAYLSTPDGVVSPASALVTGYDFLEDAARDVQKELEKGIGAPADTLILTATISPQDPRAWTAEDLRALVVHHRYDIAFLAGHFSAGSALAADYSTRFLSTEVVSSTVDMTNAIFYSAGCHSGYNIVDAHDVPGVTLEPDWAQAFARQGATLIAGTGYQYGDTDFIEYSERLYRDFTRQLRQGNSPVPLGQALTDAKHQYMAGTANWRGIHTKSVMQATLFGLPMLRVDFPQRNAAMQPLSTADISQIDAVMPFTTNPGLTLELAYADLTVTPPLTRHTVHLTTIDGGTMQEIAAAYFSGPEGVVANPMEPALPLAIYEVGFPDMAMRGIGFRGGAYTDHEDVLALTGAPATEMRGVHGLFPTSVFYPIRPWQVNYFQALRQQESSAHLMLTPAQYWFEFDESGGDLSGQGRLRQFETMDFRFYYSSNTESYNGHVPALAAPPTLSQIEAVSRGDVVTFTARAYGDPAAGIQEVWVTYSAISGTLAGEWQSLDLVQDDEESTLWRGVLTLEEGASPEALRYIVQAVNGVGLVSMDTNLGEYHSLATIASETPGPPPEPPQSTLLNLTVSSSRAPYGARITVTAQLMITGTNISPAPVAGERIAFGLGSQRRYAQTDANGAATVRMALLTSPGDYEMRAAFQGNSKFEAASMAHPFTITRQATNITLEPDSMAAIAALGADGMLTATLTNANGGPLAETTMFFIAQGATRGRDYEAALTTNYLGRATVAAADLPAYLQSVLVTFGDAVTLQDGAVIDLRDERYLPSSKMLSQEGSVLFLPLVIRQSD